MKQSSTGWAWWDSQKPWIQTALCIGFLIILPLFLSPDTIIGDKQFLASDIVQWRGGAESILQAREKYGYEPLWASNMYGGMPAYFISYQLSVVNFDSLIHQLFAKIFPAATFWVGLIGLFFFFRLFDIKHFYAVFGAITIAFTTYIPILIGAGHNSKFYAFNFIPWVFLGFFMILMGKKRPIISLATFALALTLELRAGHPQVTYYFAIVLGIVWLFDVVQQLKEKSYSALIRKNSLFLAGIILVVLSVIQPYWSKSEFTPFSNRGGSVVNTSSGLDLNYAMAWSQGWGELMTLIIPNAYGGASGEGSYWGPKAFTSGPHYLGALAVLFFILSLVYYKGKWKAPFLTAGILTMLFSLGNNFLLLNEFMFHYFPFFSKFRTPEMWLIASVFSFGFLAVLGLQSVLESGFNHKKWLYVSGGVLGFAFLFALSSSSFLSFEKPNEKRHIAEQIAQSNRVSVNDPRVQQTATNYLKQEIPKRAEAAQSDSWRFFFIVFLGVGAVYLVSTKKISAGYAGLAIVVISAFDMISVGTRYIPEHSKILAGFNQESQVKKQLSSLDLFIKNNQFDESGVWPYRAFPIASNPFNTAAPSFYYPSIGGYTAVKIGAFQDLIDEALYDPNQGLPRASILSMLNVKYMPIPQQAELPGFKIAHSDQSGVVLELENVLPKVWFTHSITKANSPKEALDFIKNPAFNPALEAVAEGIETSFEAPLDSTSKVEVTRYEPRKIEIKTANLFDGFLVLSEVFYPKGWTAQLDGNEIPIFKTNFVLRGMQIPAGNHTVVLEFNPKSHELGSKIAWLGSIFVWGLLVLGIFIEIKHKDE